MSIYERAIKKWGKEVQILMMIEEMTELALVLFHSLRGRKVDNWEISEEIADVEIMLEQMKIVYHNKKEIIEFKQQKLKRLEERLKNGN